MITRALSAVIRLRVNRGAGVVTVTDRDRGETLVRWDGSRHDRFNHTARSARGTRPPRRAAGRTRSGTWS